MGWDGPVEVPVYRTLTEALASGRLKTSAAAGDLQPFILGPDLPDDTAAMFERTESGRCVFLDPSSHLCIVHRDLGEKALAATCRHFPRLAVHDARGTFVALSHFCPTAAATLFRDDVALRIVEDPVSFPPADYDGLNVTDEDLPPLLHPHMLMDLDGYTAWEAHAVSRCVDARQSPESVLATLARDAEALGRWRPGSRSLPDAVAALPGGRVEASETRSLQSSLHLRAQCLRAVPPDLLPDADEDGLEEAFAVFVAPHWHIAYGPVNRYIATKAFASWTAYQGRGIRTVIHGIEAAVSLVRVEAARECRDAQRPLDRDLLLEAFRSADFVLNHQAVGDELAANWGSAIGE